MRFRSGLLLLVLIFSLVSYSSARLFSTSQYESAFSSFLVKHERSYPREEMLFRFKVFQDNYDFIHQHNEYNQKNNIHYTVGVNQFADLTQDEFRIKYASGFKPKPDPSSPSHPLQDKIRKQMADTESAGYPPSIDWRTKNVVLPILDQGQCGSSPYFSAADPLSAAWAISKNILIPLSVQQLVDCVTVDNGCNGGFMSDSYDYVISNKGICDNSSYPYTAVTGTCLAKTCNNVASLSSYLTLSPGDEVGLVGYLNVGPAASAMDATMSSFQLYTGGVYNDAGCSSTPNHGIPIFGYGVDTTNGTQPYWLLKNSWTTAWGEKGYARIARGVNRCGIAAITNLPLI